LIATNHIYRYRSWRSWLLDAFPFGHALSSNCRLGDHPLGTLTALLHAVEAALIVFFFPSASIAT
jgi:hypothetical protein